jgi:hypothetical protein
MSLSREQIKAMCQALERYTDEEACCQVPAAAT